MQFKSIGAFVTHMQRQIATLPQAKRHVLDVASEALLDDVREIPGTYQKGWKPLAEVTMTRRVALGFPADEPLLMTGELRDSYKRRVVSQDRAAVGSDNKKATIHELGTSKIPPRPVLGVAAARQEKRLRTIIGKGIADHLSGRRR